ncbi:initiation factor 2 [Jackrogersella minutella]|nr:initiation factor 2 [Jackrogersella minutella]
MLRASLSKRESCSICAFCQHRLSLRLATPRNRRQLSSTRNLGSDDGWGSWGSQSRASPQSKDDDDFLNRHELLARQQLLAKQQTTQPSEPGNGLRSKNVWNAKKQKEIEENLSRDGMTFRNDSLSARRDTTYRGADERSNMPRRPIPREINPFGRKTDNPDRQDRNIVRKSMPQKQQMPDISELGGWSEKSPTKEASSASDSSSSFFRKFPGKSASTPAGRPLPMDNNRFSPSRDNSKYSRTNNIRPPLRDNIRYSQPNNRPPLIDNSLHSPATNISPFRDNSLYSPGSNRPPLGDKSIRSLPDNNPLPPPQTQWERGRNQTMKPQATLGNIIHSSKPLESESSWGMLAKKMTAPKPDSENFWATVNGSTNSSERKKSPSTGSSGQSGSQGPWDALRESASASAPDNLYDWGADFHKKAALEEKEKLSSIKEEAAEPALGSSEVTRGTEQSLGFKGRDRDRGRDRRLSRFELGGDDVGGRGRGAGGGGGGGKRLRRGSNLDDDGGFDYDEYQERRRAKAQRRAQREAERTGPIPIQIPELINIKALAEALKVKPKLFLQQLAELGFEEVSLESLMAGETAALVAQEYGFEPTVEIGRGRDILPRPPPEDLSILPERPPVVTIMGHVDHGKTTLLDYMRKSSIAAQEHGGITQRIGAFSVKLSSGKPITFLDTPGHAAFLSMRQRGASVTDIVVLVVAADDSVKPQTIEAIKHSRAAKVPMIVAISKVDKDGARIDQVKHDLAREGVEIEDFGGDVQVVCVSGKTGQGMDDLEENILTLSEILDHRAERDGPAEGWVLESSLKSIGKAATVLVKRGTLRPGDYIAAGLTWAKIRHLRSEAGVDIVEAPPGTPVEILGWKDLPAAGDQVIQAPDEGRAKDAVEYREGLRERKKDAAAHEEISEARRILQEKRALEKAVREAEEEGLEDAVPEPLPEKEDGTKIVNFVVKGDLHGSVEAVEAAILELGNNEVRPRILRTGTGPIHEFDVEHAATSKSIIVNFATTTPGYIKQMAEEQGVEILDHTVIYHLVDDVKANMSKHLAPEVTKKVLGEAEVLQVFPINIKGRKYKNIAGCRVRNGQVAKGSLYRVIRKGDVIFEGKLETLKHLKKDVTEVNKGTECGVGFLDFQDFETGDQIQAYEEITKKRSL